jgi:ferric-dicitrate binding protein FerR (iron transport regulator)
MDKSKLYQLLSGYLTQKSVSSPNKEMNKAIRQTSDEELGSVLSDLWNDYELTESYDNEIAASFNLLTQRIRRKRIRMQTMRVAKYAAMFLLPLLTVMTSYLLIERVNYQTKNENFSVHASPGKSSDIVLPDGTEVALNSQSTLTYSSNDHQNKRRVSLQGEANFKVTKNPHKPFIVSTECFDVEVLGTTFNVKTYESDKEQEVALAEGKVKLTTRNLSKNTTIFLKPNEKAIYNKTTGELRVEATDNNLETAWLKGVLMFHTESLRDINKELERKYDVHIQMNCPKIENDSFTGTFDNKTLVEVLDNLKIHYGFNYSIDKKQVQIYSSKAN